MSRTLSTPIATLLLGVAAFAVSLPARSLPITLGAAAEFNALVLGDMTARNSDVEGRLAVRGNVDIKDFSVGLLLEDSAGSRDDLIVGGDATLRQMRVDHGNAVIGGAADIDESVGFYSGENTTGTGGHWRSGSVVDFDALQADLLQRSALWGGLAATGSTIAQRNDANALWDLRFEGGNGLNIFSVSAEDFSSPDKRITFDLPESGVALVNVSGTDVSLFNTGFFHTAYSTDSKLPDNTPEQRHDGRYTNGILFNFFEAQSLTLHAVGIRGSILAPMANTSFYDGHIDGNFIVGSLSSPENTLTGQINDYRFTGTPSDVPVPATLLLLIGGLTLLARQRPRF